VLGWTTGSNTGRVKVNRILGVMTKPAVVIFATGFMLAYLLHDYIKAVDRRVRKWIMKGKE
jgi:hypothetical protein